MTTASADDPPRSPVTEAQLVRAGRAGRSALRIARVFSAFRFSFEFQELADVADWLLGDEGDPGSPWPLQASVEPRVAVAPPESPSAAFAATESSEPGSGRSDRLRGSYGAPQRQRSDPETAEAVRAAVGGDVGQSEAQDAREDASGGVSAPDDPATILRRAADELDRRAAAATPGPWFAYDVEHWPPDDAAWVALMGPQVAAPLVAWLRERAAYVDGLGGICNEKHALALAAAILGEAAR